MSSVTVSVNHPHRLAAPRGAIWLGTIAALMIDSLKRLDEWMIERRQRRANDVEELLALASRVEATDPGFASDLRGAAMRGARRDEY